MATSSSRKPALAKRDPTFTRQKILNCATHCFAKSGFRGTSLSEIISKAAINKRMIYHYFGSKKGLYEQVHAQQWEFLAEWFREAMGDNTTWKFQQDSPKQLLMKALEIFQHFSAQHQDFLRLQMWDGLEGGMVSRSLWTKTRGPIYQKIEALMLLAQEQGVISSQFRVDHLIVSFMGAIFFYFSYANSLKDVFRMDPLEKTALEQRNEQMLLLFEKIFEKKNGCS